MALVDADYKFIWANLGSAGSASDALIYNNSEIKELAEDETITFPTPDPLPNDYQDVPYFSIGDDAFALRETMMKPYSHWSLTMKRGYLTTDPRQEGGSKCFRNPGVLFQVLLTTMQHHPSTVKVIVKACIVLYNLMRIGWAYA